MAASGWEHDMNSFLLVMSLAVTMILVGAITDAGAQAPATPAIDGPIHAVTYIEVMPTSRADGVAALKRYRETTRTADGNLRCEVVSRIGQPHQLVVLEIWKDQ